MKTTPAGDLPHLREPYKQSCKNPSSEILFLHLNLCVSPGACDFKVYLIKAISKAQVIRHVANKPVSTAVPGLDRFITRCQQPQVLFHGLGESAAVMSKQNGLRWKRSRFFVTLGAHTICILSNRVFSWGLFWKACWYGLISTIIFWN